MSKKTAFAAVKQRRLENLKPYDFKTVNLKTNFLYLRPELPDEELPELLLEPDERLLLPELPELTEDRDWLPELLELTADFD